MTMTMRDNFVASYAGIDEGTNANTFKTTYAISYVINGVGYYKAATDNIAFTAGTALAAKQRCLFWVTINAAGTVATVQSEIKPATTEHAYVASQLSWPHFTDRAVLGAIVIQTNNAATFTPGSTDLGATDVVDTYVHAVLDYGKPVLL